MAGKITKNITNQTFGNLLVLGYTNERQANGHVIYLCKCICGNLTKVAYNNIVTGITKSCGCLHKLSSRIKSLLSEDLTNIKFGKLTVIKQSFDHLGKNKHSGSRFLCKCDCGNEKIILGYNLRSGDTKSCGCLLNEICSNLHKNKKAYKQQTCKICNSKFTLNSPKQLCCSIKCIKINNNQNYKKRYWKNKSKHVFDIVKKEIERKEVYG